MYFRSTSKSSVDLDDESQEDLSQVFRLLLRLPFVCVQVFFVHNVKIHLFYHLLKFQYSFPPLQYECIMCEEKHYHTKRLFVVRELPGYQVYIVFGFDVLTFDVLQFVDPCPPSMKSLKISDLSSVNFFYVCDC